MEEEDPPRKAVMLFGRDVSEIPCFKNSHLYGILGGIGAGLLFFMFTSKIRMATHVALGSYVGIASIYWIRCRYIHSVSNFNLRQMRYAIDNKITYEGTERQEEIEGSVKTES